MNKLIVGLLVLVASILIVALGGYLFEHYANLYKYLIWLVSAVIAVLLYIVFTASSKPIYSSLHNEVTGLPNEHLFLENLEQVIAYASRNAQHVHIIYMQMRQFDTLQDSYGETVAQSVLIEIVKRLRDTLRTSDIIAHIGDDSFAVIPRDIEEEKYFFEVVDKLNAVIDKPIMIDGDVIVVEMNINTSFYPDNGLTAQELMDYSLS
ncbi:MAG: diguanylate cyclase [Campylobacterota bacterium]|nr:diguanylate cyclase [Campylobacterota bacterium]